jgi:choline-glycine betaine transporter
MAAGVLGRDDRAGDQCAAVRRQHRSLKSAVVLTSLPFSLILLLMMWGLHKAFYLESQKQIAQMHSLAPVSAHAGRAAGASA